MGDTWVGQEGIWRMEGVGLWGTVGGIEGDMSVEGAGLWEDSPRRTEGDMKDAGGDLGWWGGIGLWGTVSGKGKRRHEEWKSRPVVRTVRSCSRGHGGLQEQPLHGDPHSQTTVNSHGFHELCQGSANFFSEGPEAWALQSHPLPLWLSQKSSQDDP